MEPQKCKVLLKKEISLFAILSFRMPSINPVFSYCRTALLFSIILTAGAGFISAFSPNYISLLALRFLVGMGVGGTHVFSSWFLEFVPAKNRGAWMIVFSVFWTIGTIFEASLAWVRYSVFLCWRSLYLFEYLLVF